MVKHKKVITHTEDRTITAKQQIHTEYRISQLAEACGADPMDQTEASFQT